MSAVGVPSGTVTFLFTDVEGSTRLWADRGEGMRHAMALHDRLLREAIESHSGYVFTTAGDSFAAAFSRAADALRAAVALRRSIGDAVWPSGLSIRVRVGLHTGEAHERDGDYFGSAVNRAARLMSAAHGGQVVVSGATRDVLVDVPLGDVELVAIGEHPLKDFDEPVSVFEVVDAGQPERFFRLRIEQPTPGNLPARLEPLVGRGDDVEAVLGLLEHRDVVTIVGVGGIGKTRLAFACADRRRSDYEHGVWVCELAPIGEPEAVAQAIGQTIGARQHPGRSMVDSVAEYCRRRRMLLVLDNCEHVLDIAGDMVEALAEIASGVDVIATSREALGVAGEQLYPLGSLPSEGDDAPAVELFVQRAGAALPGVAWGDGEIGTIERICARLDGMPLAIELAATRVRSLALGDIEQQLNEAFRVLRGGRRSVERHRTLEAAIDWSYQSLADADRVVFDRLSVFAGGFDLTAATAVCADGQQIHGDEMIDLLDDLVGKSLVVAERIEGTTRYRLLEPLRQYAEDRLAASGDAERTRQRHLGHFVAWAEEWRTEIPISGLGWRQRLEREFANLRASVHWAIMQDDPEAAARIVGALEFAQKFLQMLEVGEWAERVLEMSGIDALPQGPHIARLVSAHRWWQGDLHGLFELVGRAQQMPAFELYAEVPDVGRALAALREITAKANQDPRVGVHALDDVDRTDALVDVDCAWLRLAWPWEIRDADWARPTMAAEHRVLDHRTSTTGSSLFAAIRHHRRAHEALDRGDYRAAADESRQGIAAAVDVGATFFVHFNLITLTQALSQSGDNPADDLALIASALVEQRDAGQVADQWLLVSGAAGILYRHGRIELARDVLSGMIKSPWDNRTPARLRLATVLGADVDDYVDGEPVLDLDQLVDRTLAAIDELLDSRSS